MQTYTPSAGRPELRHLEALSQRFHDLDLADAELTGARAALDHATHLARAAIELPAKTADHAAAIAAQLASGEIDVDKAVESVTGMQSHAAAIDTVRDTLRAAASEAERRAVDDWTAAGDEVIGACDREVRNIGDEAAKLAPKVSGIGDDTAAVRAGRGAASAWATLHALAERLDEIRDLADQLRARRIATVEPHKGAYPEPEQCHYLEPWRLQQSANDGNRPATVVHGLLAELHAGLCERTQAEFVADFDDLQAGYDAVNTAALAERRGERERARQIVAEQAAAADERQARRDAERVAALTG